MLNTPTLFLFVDVWIKGKLLVFPTKYRRFGAVLLCMCFLSGCLTHELLTKLVSSVSGLS